MSHGHGHRTPREIRIGRGLPELPKIMPGSPDHIKLLRKKAAELVRDIRNMRPKLKGEWTHRQWNEQARNSGRRYLKNMTQFSNQNKD